MNDIAFKNRREAIAYWRNALFKEDEKLQNEIQYRLKRMDEIRKNIAWNEQEWKREMQEKKVSDDDYSKWQ